MVESDYISDQKPAIRVCACGVKLSILNKGDTCYRCTEKAAAAKLPVASGFRAQENKSRKPQVPKSSPVVEAPRKTRSYTMEKLVAEEIAIEDVPENTVDMKRSGGRAGELWDRLLALKPGIALKVTNRDIGHAGTTSRDLREKAKKLGREAVTKRSETTLYCYLKPVEKQPKH